MINSTVTCIVNGKTYRLCVDDTKGMRTMSSVDRQQLIDVLEVLKKQQPPVKPVVQHVVQHTEQHAEQHTVQDSVQNVTQQGAGEVKPRSNYPTHVGDANALAAQLLQEEKNKQKPPLTKRTIYKWIGGLTIVALVLIGVFS